MYIHKVLFFFQILILWCFIFSKNKFFGMLIKTNTVHQVVICILLPCRFPSFSIVFVFPFSSSDDSDLEMVSWKIFSDSWSDSFFTLKMFACPALTEKTHMREENFPYFRWWFNLHRKWNVAWIHSKLSASYPLISSDFRTKKNGPFVDFQRFYLIRYVCIRPKKILLKTAAL